MKDSDIRLLTRGGLVLAGVLAALKPLRESDLFWHLALGRAVLRTGARVVPEPMALLDFGATRVVPEWLWDLALWLLWSHGGAVAVTLLVALCGAALGEFAWRVVGGRDDETPGLTVLLLAAAALPALFGRLRERPESAALVLVLATIVALEAAMKRPRMRAIDAAALTAMAVLYAQVHSTAPLAFGLAAMAIAPRLWFTWRGGALDRVAAATLVGVGLGCLSGAHGVGILTQILAHGRGDAIAHIEDMRAPTWEGLDPSRPSNASYALLAALALFGLRDARRWTLLGMALLGAAMWAVAVRGLVFATLLLLPLARVGATAAFAGVPVVRRRLVSAFVAALAIALAIRAGTWFQGRQGPVGSLGVHPLTHPLAAAAALRALPRDVTVYASFGASAPLGFALDGAPRTFVDARTPMHFGDLEFAVSREFEAAPDPRALLARYRVGAAVLEREGALCVWFAHAPSWRAVSLVGAWTVFVRDDLATAPPLRSLAPCGRRWVAADCGSAVDDETARLASTLPAAEQAALALEVSLSCNRPLAPGLEDVLRDVPPRGAATAWARSLLARTLARRGELDEALSEGRWALSEGRVEVLSELAPALQRAHKLGELRELLESAVSSLDDATPWRLRLDLATTLAARGDAEGARFHGVRVAAQGHPEAMRVLRWLSTHHPNRAARDDALRWIEALSSVGRTQPASGAQD